MSGLQYEFHKKHNFLSFAFISEAVDWYIVFRKNRKDTWNPWLKCHWDFEGFPSFRQGFNNSLNRLLSPIRWRKLAMHKEQRIPLTCKVGPLQVVAVINGGIGINNTWKSLINGYNPTNGFYTYNSFLGPLCRCKVHFLKHSSSAICCLHDLMRNMGYLGSERKDRIILYHTLNSVLVKASNMVLIN